MKKIAIVFSLLFVLSFFLFFFRNSSYTLNELTDKFDECYNEIESITDKYNLNYKCLVTNKVQSLKDFSIIINDNSNIDIRFSSNATETKKGSGMFSISYTISNVSDDIFDIKLFTELANSISGKTITSTFVYEFLTAPEEKYSAKKYGLSGDGYDIEKMYALNFLEDWFIGYNLTYDNHAELWLYGYIK